MHTKLWSGNRKGRNHSEDLGIEGKIKENRVRNVDRLHMTQDRDN